MGLWIQTLKPDVEQLEQAVQSKPTTIFVWPHFSEDTSSILCSLIVYYSAPIVILIPIMSQLIPVKLTYPFFPCHILYSYLCHCLPNGPFSSGVLNPTFILHLYHVGYMLYPSCSQLFDFCNKIWQVLQISKLSTVSYVNPPVASSHVCPNILLSMLYSCTCGHVTFPPCERPSITPTQNQKQSYFISDLYIIT